MKTKSIRKIDYRIAASAMRYPTEATALSSIIDQIERSLRDLAAARIPGTDS